MDLLRQAFHRGLRAAMAALALAGALLASVSAVPAFARLGTTAGLAFVAVALGGLAVAVGVLRGVGWLLVVLSVASGAQVAAVIGVSIELAVGVNPAKARQIRELGVSPVAGVVINLVYSTAAVALFCWLAWRWFRLRHAARHGGRQAR